MTWDDKADAKLRALWAEGLSTAKIGERMGITKNSVIGRAHRLGLPGRASPIQAAGPRDLRAVRERVENRRKRVVDLDKEGRATGEIAAMLGVHITTVREALAALGRARPAGRRRAPLPAKVEPVPAQPVRIGRSTCRWPIGEPRTPSFRFCEAPAVQGKSYCAACCAKAYVRPLLAGEAMAPRGWVA